MFPQGFNVLRMKVPQPDGSQTDAVQLVLLDQSGTPVVAVFGTAQWEQFQRFVQDPEGEAGRAKARQAILGPGGRAPTLGKPRGNGPH